MNKKWRYEVEGSAADDQTFTVTGEVHCEFHETFEKVMRECFQKLTRGEAVYGHPGVGCSGPYGVNKVVIET
jgi:hypothetical protein